MFKLKKKHKTLILVRAKQRIFTKNSTMLVSGCLDCDDYVITAAVV